MARLRPLERLVDEIASVEADRIAAVLDQTGAVVEVGKGGPEFDPSELEFDEDPDLDVGEVGFVHDTLGAMEGFFGKVQEAGDIDWRVAVIEPRRVALERTQDALLPASFAVAIAALIAMQVAFMFGRRIAEPLRVLETRAREVASGAYIKPIEIEREDEVGRLADAFNAMAARLNALQDLSQLLASASDLDQVLDGILGSMEHIMGTGRAAVFLLNEEGQLELVKASGAREGYPELSIASSGPWWVSQAFRSGKSVSFLVHSQDRDTDPVLKLFTAEDVNSGLAVPLAIGHQPFGVLLLLSSDRREFGEAETEMARAFTAQASVAVQNSRLFEEEHQSRTEAEALREMAELLASSTGLAETLSGVGEIAAGLLEMSRSVFAMTKEDRKELEVPQELDPDLEARYLELWDGVSAGDTTHLVGGPLPVPVERLRGDPLYSDISVDYGVENLVMIPMIQGGVSRGVLVLEGRDPSRTFTLRDLEHARAAAKSVAISLETDYLFHQAQKRADNLEMVFRISQAVGLSLKTTVVLNRVMDVVQKMLPATGVSLMQFDAQHGVMNTAMARGIQDRRILYAEVEVGEDIPGRAFETRKPVRVDDIGSIDTPLGHVLASQGFRSWLCAPLLARGRSIGVLSVYSQEPMAFSEEDQDLIMTFAAQAALALDTAELFEKEHTVSSVLQSSIVPDVLPEIDWLETASVYQPAGSESEIGGDYYDMFFARDGRIVLAIGDVCGKGVRAATKTSTIKYTLRGLVTAGLGPSAALRELNAVVAEMGDVADIVTMWIGYLDPETGRLIYANAGHPPVMVHDPELGKVRSLGPTGPLLGAMQIPRFIKKAVTLAPGATILLYTDGVTEARSEAGLFGETRLREVVAKGGPPRKLIEDVLQAVSDFTSGVLRDDVAILAVRFLHAAARRPEAQSVSLRSEDGYTQT